jgi:formyl-CoA transferase
MNETAQLTSSALEGIRVLDLTHQIAGPAATMAMAYMGADVVKLVAPSMSDSYDNLAFCINNVSKRSISLDLKTPEGLAKFYELAAAADVCVENFSPGVAEKLGVSYERLSAVNPSLIYVQVKGFDAESPYADFPAFDPVAQAFSGATSITGPGDGMPVKCGPDFADTGTGMVLVSGILAALFQRTRTGRGQHVTLAMADQIATSLRISYAWPLAADQATPRFGNGAPFIDPVAPSELFPCAPHGPNDFVHIHCGNDKQWVRLAKAMGRDDLIDDARTATFQARGANRDYVNGTVREWTSRRSKFEAMEILGAAGVPAGAVRDTLEVLNDPDLANRGIFVPVKHAELGDILVPGWPIRMSGSRVVVSDPPRPGEHTDEVLEEWLGGTRIP